MLFRCTLSFQSYTFQESTLIMFASRLVFRSNCNFLVGDSFDDAVSKRMSSQGSTAGTRNGIAMGVEND